MSRRNTDYRGLLAFSTNLVQIFKSFNLYRIFAGVSVIMLYLVPIILWSKYLHSKPVDQTKKKFQK